MAAGAKNLMTSSRLRSKASNQQEKQNEMEERGTNQANLHKKKVKELKIRLDSGKIQTKSAKKKVKQMDTLVAYKQRKDFPKDIVPGQIYVDMRRHAVLIPNSPTTFIPVHVGTIKSVSDKQEGQWTFLRINFNIASSPTMEFPAMPDPNNIFMKALTMKTPSTGPNNRLSQAAKQIKECMK